MPRTKVSDEQKKKSVQKAVNKYHKDHMKIFSFRFHCENQRDIIEHLESQKNKAGYIADLIRKDLIAQGKQPVAHKRVCDLINEYMPLTATLFFKDGSKMVGDGMMFKYDDRLVDDYNFDVNARHLVIYVRYS